jgi:hypothetical protein
MIGVKRIGMGRSKGTKRRDAIVGKPTAPTLFVNAIGAVMANINANNGQAVKKVGKIIINKLNF